MEGLESGVEGILARGERDYKFTNWSTTFSCTPELYFEPETTEEIREVVQAAGKLRKKVRVTGGGYSPSDIACTKEYMICLKKYKAVLEINHEKQQVTVQAGLTVMELNELLDRHGLALSNLSSVSGMSCAGTIGTCTHGSGKNYGLLATFVVALELMITNGEIIHCSRDENKEIFLAALCNLGAVGIILSVTWQCESAFRLHQQCESMTLEQVLENLDTWLSSDEHFKFHWYPHTGHSKVYHVNRTSKPITENSSWFWDKAVGYWSLEFMYWLSSFVPRLVPFINWSYFQLLHSKPQSRVDQSYKCFHMMSRRPYWCTKNDEMAATLLVYEANPVGLAWYIAAGHIFNFDCLFKQYVTEWAIPQDKTAYVLRELQKWIKESGFNAHFPIEVRFVKKDDIYMSPCYGQDVCFINIISFRPYDKFIPFESYWKFYEDLMMSVGGKPHWAKAHSLTSAQIEKMFPKFNEFRQICQKLDPHGMFHNEYLERVIFGSTVVPEEEKSSSSSSNEQGDRQYGTQLVGPGL